MKIMCLDFYESRSRVILDLPTPLRVGSGSSAATLVVKAFTHTVIGVGPFPGTIIDRPDRLDESAPLPDCDGASVLCGLSGGSAISCVPEDVLEAVPPIAARPLLLHLVSFT